MHKILLIDDDVTGSQIIAAMLKSRGFDVFVLYNGAQTLEALEREKPDLVLLDIIMPGVTGIEVLESIRKKTSPIDLPVVMLTSVDDSIEIANCLKLGANDYLTKPVDVEVAMARIRTQLKLSDLNRESLKKKEIETLNAMIVTYNHEINNPLAVVMMVMPVDVEKMTQDKLDAANEAIQKIAGIVKRIDGVTMEKIEVENYDKHDKMIKI